MKPLSKREEFLFMMAINLGLYLGESGHITFLRELEKFENPEADITTTHLRFAKNTINRSNFDDDVRMFAKTVGVDINSIGGTTDG